ncbi:MAG: hypothetical protein KJ804_07110 [Proteobacteria bacterium]|nr:hypothetical protein [Pseudomonadota bacterium]MBU1058068.1 hypothetical protein [Pseudomonadota bacterium]
MRSLRRLSAISFLGTALLLAALVLTGFRQNILMSDYSIIVKESESTIFLYATIREQATEGLLSRDSTKLLGAAKEFEHLHGRYTSMLDNHLIPSQYKLSFLQELDLEQVVINLRNLAENTGSEELILKTISQLRQINKQFLQFDRIVVNEMRNRVMQYQKRGLVLMGLIILLTCSTLIILYRKSVKPLIDLAAQTEMARKDGKPLQLKEEKKWSVEVRALITSFNELLQKPKEINSDSLTHNRREAEFSAIVNDVTNRLNGIINYSQLLVDYCEVEEVADEQRQILHKIIENGEKSALILQKGLHGGDV